MVKMADWVYKLSGELKRILMWLFVLFMGAQIITGIGWLLANMGSQPLFWETSLMLKGAETLMIDEYMGILYPVLIAAAKWISKILPLPYYTFLYVMQLGMAVLAAFYVLSHNGWMKGNGVTGKLKALLAAGYLLTFPLLLQMHLAVLPYSLAMSVTIILVCDGLYYLRNPEKMCVCALMKLCSLWVLDVLLLPDYSWLAGVFVVGVLGRVALRVKTWRVRIVIAVLAAVLCFELTESVTQTPGSMGRIQKTASAALMHRFVWPNFGRDSFFWDEQITEVFDYDDLEEIAKYSEKVIYDFGPGLEAAYGREKADILYGNMALTALQLDTKQILINVGRDFGAYVCPPAAFQMQTLDNPGSLLGWNYGRLQEQAPVLTKYYSRIAFTGWNVLCILSVLLICLQKRKVRYESVLLLLCAVFMALWYTLQAAGMQDYKKVMLISFVWLLPVIKGFVLSGNTYERGDCDGL